jgi:hypothetical protein
MTDSLSLPPQKLGFLRNALKALYLFGATMITFSVALIIAAVFTFVIVILLDALFGTAIRAETHSGFISLLFGLVGGVVYGLSFALTTNFVLHLSVSYVRWITYCVAGGLLAFIITTYVSFIILRIAGMNTTLYATVYGFGSVIASFSSWLAIRRGILKGLLWALVIGLAWAFAFKVATELLRWVGLTT